MVALATPARSRASPFPHRVRIVETDEPRAVRRVQCQRVAEPVRTIRCHFGPQHDELHPVSRLVNEQRLAVKVEQGVQPGIAVSRRHRHKLSVSHNKKKVDAEILDRPARRTTSFDSEWERIEACAEERGLAAAEFVCFRGGAAPNQLYLTECRAGDRSAAHARLEALEGVALVDASPDAEDPARRLLDPGAVPREAAADAAHIAIAVTNGVEYLVTWNLRHIANAAMRVRIERACRDWSDKRETARRVKQRISARRWLIP